MFKRLFGKSQPLPSERPKLSQALSVSIVGVVGTQSIPSMSRAAQRAFEIATNPSAEAKDFVEVLESDEALSAKILKIANSVYYDRGSGSETIVDAVAAIGTSDLRDLLNASTLSNVFSSSNAYRKDIWEHDIAVGLAARLLAKRFLPDKQEEAFLAGLMHDIGKLLLLRQLPEEYSMILEQVQEGVDTCQAEEDKFPFNHTEVGLLIADKWNFSDELSQVIRYHHHSWEEQSQNSLIGLVKAADILVHACGIGIAEKISSLRDNAHQQLDEVYQFFDIDSAEQKPLLDEVRRVYDSERELYTS